MPYAVRGKFVDGRIVFEAPPDWPDGLDLRLEPIGPPDEFPDDWDESPAAEARRLELMDEHAKNPEPWMSPEDSAAWERQRAEDRAWRHARRAYENSLNPRPAE